MPTIENIRLHTFKEPTLSTWEIWENRLLPVPFMALFIGLAYLAVMYFYV